jgi:hypothetical protein
MQPFGYALRRSVGPIRSVGSADVHDNGTNRECDERNRDPNDQPR